MEVATVNTLEDGCPQYRLGDAVLLRHTQGGKGALDCVATNPGHFADSILFEYASMIDPQNSEPQWHILKDIVFKKTQEVLLAHPRENELVVHLRMGDRKGFKLPAETFESYICDVVDNLDDSVTLVTIVTAIHFGKTRIENQLTTKQLSIATSNDIRKAHRIVELLSEKSLNVRLYSHKDIDRDFCFLSNAKYLVLGNGHFSACAAMISNTEYFIPPWAGKGSEVNIDELLKTRIRILDNNLDSTT